MNKILNVAEFNHFEAPSYKLITEFLIIFFTKVELWNKRKTYHFEVRRLILFSYD